MMKFMLMSLFILLMVIISKNLKKMFYYNLCYIMSFMFIFMFMEKSTNFWSISSFWGCDMFSYFLILLSMWVMGLMFMSLEIQEKYMKLKILIFIIMLFMLMNFFFSMNLLMFYLYFEMILIPTFFLVIYWGGNPERLSAALYLVLYMLSLSLPFLYYIFKMYKLCNSLSMSLMSSYEEMFSELSFGAFIIIMGVFLVKLPMYILHIWLPKAHVEAPVYGSMVLAAILLKLGGYGLLRLMVILIMKCMMFSQIIFSIGIIGALYVGILCLIQVDMKMLVAYSSVVHMNMMLSSMMTMFKMGFIGAFIMMISHGLCSSGLFYMVNLYYKWTGSRMLMINKGVMNLFPSLSMWWFLLCVANFSFPLSLNFISEILMISVIVSWENFMIMYLMIICFLSSVYSLYLYSFVQHGGVFMEKEKFNMISFMKEFMVILLHFYPLLMILLNLIMFF